MPGARARASAGDSAIGRRRFLLGAASTLGLFAAAGCAATRPSRSRGLAASALERCHDWLWGRQDGAGLFPSDTYGLLASGQSLTPFVVESLLAAPPESAAPRTDAVERAISGMLALRNADGALGLARSHPDYPCYATGLLLSCLGAAGGPQRRPLAASSVAWLRAQQFRAASGWSGHPAQGGWGMGGRTPRRPPHAGHVDLSMTRRVLVGLRACGVPPDDPALVEARDFVARCQTEDGSFVYSPVELALNKGLRDAAGRPRGYGSATADGLLCLGALDLAPDGASEAALAWLRAHHRVDRNPGVVGGPMEPFAEAMRGYYRAAAAECFARFGGPPGWRESLARVIASEQFADGHLVGTSALQKEDDPIVATALAARALAAVLA